MEEDIKILEELTTQKYSERLLKSLSYIKEEDEIHILTMLERQAIEKIIKEYRELEEIVNKYGGAKELEEYILELSRFLGNVSIDAMINTIKNDYIPKSKIKEKKEEYKQIIDKYEKQVENDEETDLCYEEIREYACRIETYQELLEEK